MPDYREQFKSCGRNVVIDDNVFIEHPERLEVGNNVRFDRGFYMQDGPGVGRIGSNVRFYPNCFIQGSAARFVIEDDVDFFPGTYISLGDATSFVEIGHHSHFAPNCVLYGWGGLKIGSCCNVAAHCVLATVGHDPVIRDKPMAMVNAVRGPDHAGRGCVALRQRDGHRRREDRARLHHRRQCGGDAQYRAVWIVCWRPRPAIARPCAGRMRLRTSVGCNRPCANSRRSAAMHSRWCKNLQFLPVLTPYTSIMIEHTIEFRVRYPEVDAMGYVHNSRFLQYFEMGRVELLARMGSATSILKSRASISW